MRPLSGAGAAPSIADGAGVGSGGQRSVWIVGTADL